MTSTQSAARERFTQIFTQCETLLLGHARRLTKGDNDRAQDLVQDALVRGYQAILDGKFLEGLRPCAWLSRILTNHFINEWRRSKKWDAGVTVDTLTAGGETGPAATQSPGVEAELTAETLDESLAKALDSLPEALRMTVLLVDVQEYSYIEAAEALGVPVGTVRSRLSRARFALHEALAAVAKEKGWQR
ncbi:MAG: sigma-70 family RNA polymerase sigma factor [Armatimonas sp.]